MRSTIVMAPLRILVIGLLAAVATGAGTAGNSRWWSHVTALASDKMEGRDTGSAGERRAAEYTAREFRRAGLRPLGAGGYLHPVPLTARRVVDASSTIDLVRGATIEPLVLGEDVVVNAAIAPHAVVDAPLVFVGYGLRIPELQYDDLNGLDVRGALVVRLAGAPSTVPAALRSHYQSTAELSRGLADAGALGVITIQSPGGPGAWAQLMGARPQQALDLADPPANSPTGRLHLALTVNRAHAETWFAGSGHTIEDLERLVRDGARLPGFPLVPHVRARLTVDRHDVMSQNVIAVLPGWDAALSDEYVVVSAHLDHLGVADAGDDRVFNGALDNASGVATLLEVGRMLARGSAGPRRSVMFVAVTGEEKGMLGSRHFTRQPPVAPASIVAAINCDMFLPLHPLRMITAFGMAESDLGDRVQRVAAARGLGAQDDPVPSRNTFARSDQYSFVRIGIPSLMVSIGAERGSADEQRQQAWLSSRYHSTADDSTQPVDLQAAADFNLVVLALVQNVASQAARPEWHRDSFFRRFEDRPE
jgi:Zn-dependent M28 family amino/carboxypeptidase